ncbi:coiled-coil domain-containing protein 157-like [Corapipo altera]|uniref:coiled-coil domain-containing protein 157-like n=1 Tax=Corapipo altera TaxID=415028 RepID=UPI000FD6558F|nr:coiled-coil domain-containing protein 157-like [Corapipo altera]
MEKSHNNPCGTPRRQHRGWERRDGHKKGRWGAASAAEAAPWSLSLGCTAVPFPQPTPPVWALMDHFQFDLGTGPVLCSLPQDKDCRKEIPTQQSPPHSLGSLGSSQPKAGPSLAQGTRSVPTQTSRCPLGSCDSCSSAQASLREVGRAITSLCQSQNIPSALSKFQGMLEDSTGRRSLSATELSYWATEQSKDLSRINKHLQELLQQLNPVKAELEKVGKQKEELRKQVEDFSWKLQAERETQVQQQRKAEQSLKAKDKEHSEAVARLEQDKDDLRRGAALLEERLSTLKEELEVKQAALQELELTKTTLLEEMRTTMVARSQMLELEEKVQMLTGQRDSLEQELSATSLELEKEKVRVQSVLLHEESLQAKQKLLLQQLDRLDREQEELQNSLGEAEEDKARLEEQLEQSREQSRKQLQVQQELLDTLQQEKLALEQSILELQTNTSRLEEQAQELRERERLLVFFPELHVPTEAQFESRRDAHTSEQAELHWILPAGTGNLTEDMENQLQANSIRIGVLERENARLGAVLAKVKAAAQQGVLKLIPQAQLGSQLQGEASGQDTGWPSRGGSSDSRGMPGCTDKAWHRVPSSQHSKVLRAGPTFQARPSLSLPVGRLGLDPPCTTQGPTTNKH